MKSTESYKHYYNHLINVILPIDFEEPFATDCITRINKHKPGIENAWGIIELPFAYGRLEDPREKDGKIMLNGYEILLTEQQRMEKITYQIYQNL